MASWLNWNKRDHPRYNYENGQLGIKEMAQLGIKGKLGVNGFRSEFVYQWTMNCNYENLNRYERDSPSGSERRNRYIGLHKSFFFSQQRSCVQSFLCLIVSVTISLLKYFRVDLQ